MKKINPHIHIFYNLSLFTFTDAKLWYYSADKNEFGIKLSNGVFKVFKLGFFRVELTNQINSVDIKFRNNYEMQEFLKDSILYDNDFKITEFVTQALLKNK